MSFDGRPPGHAPPPGYGNPAHGYGVMPAGPAGLAYRGNAAPTVLGIPLEPGERVLYFAEPDASKQKNRLLVLGLVFLLCAGIGLLFLVLYFVFDRTTSRSQVVTNRRLVFVSGTGVVTIIPLADVQDLDAMRQRASGGGLAGAVVAGAINVATELQARKRDRRDPAYWSYAVNLIIKRRTGSRVAFRNSLPQRLGPFLATILANPPMVDQLPEVAYRP